MNNATSQENDESTVAFTHFEVKDSVASREYLGFALIT